MALLNIFRDVLFSWLVPSRRAGHPLRLALETLDGREVPAIGSGYTAGGLLGQYYDNKHRAGTPAFTRKDVRIDFDWQTRGPGGSNSPDYIRVGPDNFFPFAGLGNSFRDFPKPTPFARPATMAFACGSSPL